MNPNNNMAEMFGHRVRGLVSVRTDLANLIHFARLFQSQLIAVSLSLYYVSTDKVQMVTATGTPALINNCTVIFESSIAMGEYVGQDV